MLIFVPLGTTRPCWRAPYATHGLIAANVAVFAIELAAPDALPKGFVPAPLPGASPQEQAQADSDLRQL